MKTVHFIALNNCFVSIHVIVRFTHDYQDLIAENDFAIFIQIRGLFKRQILKTCSLHCMCSGTGGSLTGFKPTRKNLLLSTDNRKLICCYKTLALSDGPSFERSKRPSYWYA